VPAATIMTPMCSSGGRRRVFPRLVASRRRGGTLNGRDTHGIAERPFEVRARRGGCGRERPAHAINWARRNRLLQNLTSPSPAQRISRQKGASCEPHTCHDNFLGETPLPCFALHSFGARVSLCRRVYEPSTIEAL
jgi:hypothetical protein